MPRKAARAPLNVFLNGQLVGQLAKKADGAVSFSYTTQWLERSDAFPVSLSLPLRATRFTGERVSAVFENLLPDSKPIRTRVAERVGAAGTDAYSMLAEIGRDCVGALQFLPDGVEPGSLAAIEGTPVDDAQIEAILKNLAKAPLGLNQDDDFRISIAGAQEKTALLRRGERWLKPTGTTPTTHLFKPQIGQLPNGIDLSNSVENEYFCLKLMSAFGLKANAAEMATFGETRTLIIERFDRLWAGDGRLLRLPQEDCCQAFSVAPTRKYENEGGPGIPAILDLLQGSDDHQGDQIAFLQSQMIFWLIGATDGHGKNYSIALLPGGRFRLTPFYDVLTAEPSLSAHQMGRNQMKLAMAVGAKRHYRMSEIHGRHFVETARAANMPDALTRRAVDGVMERCEAAFASVADELPKEFPQHILADTRSAALKRLNDLATAHGEWRS